MINDAWFLQPESQQQTNKIMCFIRLIYPDTHSSDDQSGNTILACVAVLHDNSNDE